jgi:hypothetical protein
MRQAITVKKARVSMVFWIPLFQLEFNGIAHRKETWLGTDRYLTNDCCLQQVDLETESSREALQIWESWTQPPLLGLSRQVERGSGMFTSAMIACAAGNALPIVRNRLDYLSRE